MTTWRYPFQLLHDTLLCRLGSLIGILNIVGWKIKVLFTHRTARLRVLRKIRHWAKLTHEIRSKL